MTRSSDGALIRKTRVHFHEFMRAFMPNCMNSRRGRSLDEVARRVAKRHRLICFDEFHVSDIADAMILYRLLDGCSNSTSAS